MEPTGMSRPHCQRNLWFTVIRLAGFNQEDVTYRVDWNKRKLRVDARRPETAMAERRELCKKFTLPENVDLERIEYVWRPEMLIVRAPYLPRAEVLLWRRQQPFNSLRWCRANCQQVDTFFQELDQFTLLRPVMEKTLDKQLEKKCLDKKQEEKKLDEKKKEQLKDEEANKEELEKAKKIEQLKRINRNLIPSPILLHADLVRHPKTCKPTMMLEFDTRGFKPDNLKINLRNQDRTLIVEAVQEEKSKPNMQHRIAFHEEMMLPNQLKLNKMECKFKPNGLLRVSIPTTIRVHQLISEACEVPVNMA